ncbi:hypothetical protein NPIL_53701 [Nephila pilipes]|uniref:Uncharacterized protein n=1 Tax=Nephila pilipes TaxID=299642 RepID=A0A8X6TYM7_NEPPI|nr:hypothetical protein NPIL_53701 [Nephila pilipes]
MPHNWSNAQRFILISELHIKKLPNKRRHNDIISKLPNSEKAYSHKAACDGGCSVKSESTPSPPWCMKMNDLGERSRRFRVIHFHKISVAPMTAHTIPRRRNEDGSPNCGFSTSPHTPQVFL